MMDKIPSHIDELLWRVAEARDAELTADFLRRYPAMRAQLASREAMVGSMRGARPVPPFATKFVPSVAAPARRNIWLAPIAAGLLIGIAVASYQVAKYNQLAPKEPEKKTVVVPQSPVPTPPDGRVVTPRPNSNYDPGTQARPEEPPNDDGLVVLTADTSLFAALNAIRQKGLQIEIMPGVQDAPLTLQPNRDDGTIALEPMQMLQAVKTAAGFEMVDNGPEGILILPAENTTVIGGDGPRVRLADPDGN